MAGSVGVREPRSPFTVERPPPAHAPRGVPVIFGWELAARIWRAHLPDPLSHDATCARCGVRMPCWCWRFADAFLADVLNPDEPPESAPVTEEPTRELPRVQPRPRLPRRQPGASLTEEERYDGWFTR